MLRGMLRLKQQLMVRLPRQAAAGDALIYQRGAFPDRHDPVGLFLLLLDQRREDCRVEVDEVREEEGRGPILNGKLRLVLRPQNAYKVS
jgi:hypothetical protein